MKRRRAWWLMLAAGAAIVMAALAWVTVVLLRLEQAELRARAETQQQESMRLALWRLDSWLAPQIAREAARPYFEYLSYYPQERAYTRFLNAIDPGDVLTPSPLLTYRNELIPIHFQITPDGQITSPQVPLGNQRDLAEATACSGPEIDAQHTMLATARSLIDPAALFVRVEQAEKRLAVLTHEAEEATKAAQPVPSSPPSQKTDAEPVQTAQSESGAASDDRKNSQARQTFKEYTKRAQSMNQAQQGAMLEPQQQAEAPIFVTAAKDALPERVTVGPLVPLWILRVNGAGEVELLFLRRVRTTSSQCLQGFLVHWPGLRQALLEQVSDLFPHPHLEPILAPTEESLQQGAALATIPAWLRSLDLAPPTCAMITPARLTLALAWLAVLTAIPVTAAALRSSISYGDKRSRFASAVTHELRTPLTTFRMYSEMLADGMVTAPQQRQEYLDTLKRSSVRLATLVENVLAYARIEDGRSASRAQHTTLEQTLDRLLPALERRAADTSMKLELSADIPRHTPLMIDVDAVGQILFNLVDNACKYAASASDRRIHFNAAINGSTLTLTVRDHGPGIAAEHARIIFMPFERGSHQPGDTIPGVGLGLALARELARDLSGDLILDPAFTDGACFRLTLHAACV